MLSKPYASLSFGNSAAGLMSSASRSRIALPYSVRFSRCRDFTARVRVLGRGAVELRLYVRGERVRGRGVGDQRVGRRHHPAAQLERDLLPHLGVIRDVVELHALERKVAGAFGVVVAVGAVLVDRAAGGGCSSLGREVHAAKPNANANGRTHRARLMSEAFIETPLPASLRGGRNLKIDQECAGA